MKMVKSLVVLVLFNLSLAGCGYNSLQGLDEDVKASWSEVQNQFQRRSDLIPNLVETVKGYAKHEKDTLQAVIEARAKATQIQLNAKDLSNPEMFQKYQAAQDQLGRSLGRLLVSIERYPDLKANQNFLSLQAQLEGTENRIAVARTRYIDQVANYNKKVRYFPTNLTAKYLLDLQVRETFKAAESAQETPKVSF